jgi:hypothetical protein
VSSSCSDDGDGTKLELEKALLTASSILESCEKLPTFTSLGNESEFIKSDPDEFIWSSTTSLLFESYILDGPSHELEQDASICKDSSIGPYLISQSDSAWHSECAATFMIKAEFAAENSGGRISSNFSSSKLPRSDTLRFDI